MTTRPRRRQVTLWVVPDGEAEVSRQWRVEVRTLQWALGILVGALLGIGGLFVSWVSMVPQARAYGPLLEENLSLKARLLEIENKLDGVDRELRRLRLYEEQLQSVEPSAVPGFGPLDDGAVAEEDLPPVDGWDDNVWSEGEALDDLGEADLASLDGLSDRLAAVETHAASVLERLMQIELDMGETVETVAAFRARSTAVPSGWPLDGTLTSGFGWRRSPFDRRWKFHFGVDVAAPIGTVIRAPADGVVVAAEYHAGYGRMLEIDHGYDVVTRYAHNARLLVALGEDVRSGQPIATVGMTGATTGPHLHYEIYVEEQPVDPMEYLE